MADRNIDKESISQASKTRNNVKENFAFALILGVVECYYLFKKPVPNFSENKDNCSDFSESFLESTAPKCFEIAQQIESGMWAYFASSLS